ncbi:MAG: peptidoglycan-associated lipoprotein Pal [Bdellovibrionaceae bacterium]|nr:peptidoglycan-associated lipoprotein Pal [Pseudobdellovibrionaceae bacterium]MBX3032851.1 peptidoglycan-associated lipoprotein Pal [Pseudobdellovibrionaceae bacterium]
MKQVTLAVAALALVAGCKGKQTKTDDSVPMAGGGDTVESAPLSFNPQGSDSGEIAGLSTVNFDLDKSALGNAAKEKLRGNAAWMKQNGNVKLQIEGHCDARGSVEYNIALGERRANAVKAYMVSQGIAGDRLSVISYGKEKPLDNGDTESAYAKNRRANFVPLQ